MKRQSLRDLTLALACASPDEQVRIINAMTPIDLLNYDAEFEAPDRADAMVWALHDLSPTRSGVPRVTRL